MKKIGSRSVATAVLLATMCTMSISAYAAPIESTNTSNSPSEYSCESIMPIYDYTALVKTELSINAGTAEVYGSLVGYSGITDKVNIYLYLQKKENGIWTNVKTFSESFSHYKGKIETDINVDKGYSYRVKGSYYAYDGGKSEHITAYSSTIRY